MRHVYLPYDVLYAMSLVSYGVIFMYKYVYTCTNTGVGSPHAPQSATKCYYKCIILSVYDDYYAWMIAYINVVSNEVVDTLS